MSSVERHFTGKKILKKGNQIHPWKAEKGSEDCQLKSALRDATCFISLLEHNPDKYNRIFKSHRPTEMNEQECVLYFAIKH